MEPSADSLAPLVDFIQEAHEHLPFHPCPLFIHLTNMRRYLLVTLLLVCLEPLWKGDWGSGEDLFNLGFTGSIFLSVIVLANTHQLRR